MIKLGQKGQHHPHFLVVADSAFQFLLPLRLLRVKKFFWMVHLESRLWTTCYFSFVPPCCHCQACLPLLLCPFSNYLGGFFAAKVHSQGPVFCPVIQGSGDKVGWVVECMGLQQQDLNDNGAMKQAITAVNQGPGADSPVELHL